MPEADDIYTMLAGAEPDDQQKWQALSAALRGKNAQLEQQRQLGRALSVGTPQAAQTFAGGAEGEQSALMGGAAKLRELALQRLNQQRELAALQNQIGNTQFEHQMQSARENREAAHEKFEEGQTAVKTQAELKGKQAELEKIGRLPPEAAERFAFLNSGVKAIDDAEKAFNEDPKAYLSQHESHGVAIAKGLFGKEMPNAAAAGAELLPGKALLGASRSPIGGEVAKKVAAQKFEGLREKMRGQRDELFKTYGAAGYTPPQTQEENKSENAPKQQGMPAGAVKVQRNKKTGAIRYLDASGKEVK